MFPGSSTNFHSAANFLNPNFVTSNRLESSWSRLPVRQRKAWFNQLICRNLSRKHNTNNVACLKRGIDLILTRTRSKYLTDFEETHFEKNKNLITKYYTHKSKIETMDQLIKYYQFALPIPEVVKVDPNKLIFRYFTFKRTRREKLIHSLIRNFQDYQISRINLEYIENLENIEEYNSEMAANNGNESNMNMTSTDILKALEFDNSELMPREGHRTSDYDQIKADNDYMTNSGMMFGSSQNCVDLSKLKPNHNDFGNNRVQRTEKIKNSKNKKQLIQEVG